MGLARDGELTLSRATRSGLNVLASSRPLDGNNVWSHPAMNAGVLLLKDQERVLALDLGRGASK